MIDFKGQRVLVTGASKGIGEACAVLFARLGASVVVHYKKDRKGAHRVALECEKHGAQAFTHAADLDLWDEGERLVGESEKLAGPLDVVVLNHGIWTEAAIDTMSEAQYDALMNANLRGVFSVAGAAVRRMKLRAGVDHAEAEPRTCRQKGRIVFIASTAGQRGEALHSHYAASKGAVISLTKSLASELAPDGILVNCVAPGWVETPMTRPTLEDPKEREKVFRAIPLGRVATPEEIAWPVAFLASQGATFVTGEIFNVNGGAVLVG